MGDLLLEKSVQQVMQKAIEEHQIMGMNLMVHKDGEEVLYCESGMADREAGRAMSRDTIFRLYSQTKPVTAAAAMILLERGAMDLYQPVAEFLPAYANQQTIDGRTPVRPMLVMDLLRMTSGLVYPNDENRAGAAAAAVFDEACARIDTDHAMTTRELADRLAAGPLAFAPGSSWQYGTSADVLGAVIEVVSGKKFSEFLRDEIFAPLGMEDTGFWVPEEKRTRLAAAYETVTAEDGTKSMIRYTGNNLAIRNDMAKAPAYEAGGAGLASTLDDYMKFAEMLLGEGSRNGVQILRPQTVKYLRESHLNQWQQKDYLKWIGMDGFSYGNLMRICRDTGEAGMMAREGEYGWDGWLGMYFANFPKEHMTILMGMQKKDSGTFELTRRLRNVLLSHL